jgi:putative ABC transport system substrate-binding protein
MIRRREFITVLGGAAASSAWPLSAHAQVPERHIGVLMGLAEDDRDTKARLVGLRQGLEKLGWVECRNVLIDYRFAPGGARAEVFAKELVELRPDVILSNASPATAALQREINVIPIVFTGVADPIGSGFVAGLARPGGNITGFMLFESSITGKWLAMLKEVAPDLARAALVINPKSAPYYQIYLRAAEAAAPSLGIEVIFFPLSNTAPEIERAIEVFARTSNGGLLLPRTATPSCTAISSSRLPQGTACPPCTVTVSSSQPVGLCATVPTARISSLRRRPMSIASCAAPSLPICLCRRRPNTRPSSI